jgi:hypothetical protein
MPRVPLAHAADAGVSFPINALADTTARRRCFPLHVLSSHTIYHALPLHQDVLVETTNNYKSFI